MFILKGITKYYGATEILRDADLPIMVGDRVGIIGPNGCGKSTLLGIITGEVEPDRGTVQIEKGKRIGVLHQEVTREERGSAMHYLLSNVRGLADMEERKKQLLDHLEATDRQDDQSTSDKILQEVAQLEERYHMEGGYNIVHEAEKILAGLGFQPEDVQKEVNALSGGWRMRLELARLLLEEPDALLLDEPTNHLDIASMKWLENYLDNFSGSLVIVSHDRQFLNRTVTSIAAIDDGRVRTYKGDYDAYKEVRDMEMQHTWKQYNEQQARIKEIKDFIARNRVRKDRAKVVQARIKMLERMDIIVPPQWRKAISIRFPQPDRTGSPAVALQNVVKTYGCKTVLDGLNLSILRGEKVAIVGPNGSGKTTLLKIMGREIEPEEGRVSLGSNVTTHIYAQHQIDGLSPNLTVMEEMTSIAGNETVQVIRDVLGAFLFSSDDEVGRKVEHLSGGEKSRLALSKMMLKPAGLILMDEPTNHLDIESREILEQALKQYSGTLVFISHDRTFINALATRVIEIRNGKIFDYPGNYDYFEWKKSEQAGGSKKHEKAKKVQREVEKRVGKVKKKKEQKKFEAEKRNILYRKVKPIQDEMRKIENDIEKKEKIQKERQEQLSNTEIYKTPEKIRDLNRDFSETSREIEKLYERWEELNRKIETTMKEK